MVSCRKKSRDVRRSANVRERGTRPDDAGLARGAT